VTALVDNREGLLKAGMNATVEVIMSRADDVLLLPVRAVEMRPFERKPDSAGMPDSAHAARRGGDSARPARMAGRGRMAPFAQVRKDGQESWVRVKLGLANLDFVQVTDGVAEGDTVVYSLTSGAMASREAFRDRMKSRSSMSGMRSQ
jgi:HlyD family secretion protein